MHAVSRKSKNLDPDFLVPRFFCTFYVYFAFRAGTGGKTHILFLEVDNYESTNYA